MFNAKPPGLQRKMMWSAIIEVSSSEYLRVALGKVERCGKMPYSNDSINIRSSPSGAPRDATLLAVALMPSLSRFRLPESTAGCGFLQLEQSNW